MNKKQITQHLPNKNSLEVMENEKSSLHFNDFQ